MKTASNRPDSSQGLWIGPLYLDSSALAKLYAPEEGSAELDACLRGRTDLLVSDLAVTEIVSAVARRRREAALSVVAAANLHRMILLDIHSGIFLKTDLLPETHREAERLLLAAGEASLRAADALHLALASLAGAASIVTYDRRLAAAALSTGLNVVP